MVDYLWQLLFLDSVVTWIDSISNTECDRLSKNPEDIGCVHVSFQEPLK